MRFMTSYMPIWNFGCEAILRSTITILSKTYGPDTQFIMPSHPHDYNKRVLGDIKNLELVPFSGHRRLLRLMLRTVGLWDIRNSVWDYNPSFIATCDCVLSTGGDPYSSETSEGSLPWRRVLVNKYCREHKIPHVFWGSNIGPFNISEDKLKLVVRQLQESELILVRDTGSRDYLAEFGVSKNVKVVGDPAFIMKPTPVDIGKYMPKDKGKGVLGFNCSGLSQSYYNNPELFEKEVQEACRRVIKELGHSVILVPHTYDPFSQSSGGDLGFLREKIYDKIKDELKDRIGIVTEPLQATGSKYVISKCDYFAGARMHSTIAAFSSKVPTISLAYSIKAKHLNQDLFGHKDWVLPIPEFTAQKFIEKLVKLIGEKTKVMDRYDIIIPEMQRLSYKAGEYLKDLLNA